MLRPLALTLLLAVAALAGCASHPGAPTGSTLAGHADQQILDGAGGPANGGAGGARGGGPSATPAPGEGTLAGVVVDDANLTIAGASVSIVGSQMFVATDKHGAFAFPPVRAGTYKLRVLASGFQAYETDAQVQAQKQTRLTVALVPAQDSGAGYRPHVHDFWGKESEVKLMDEDFDPQAPPPTAHQPTLDPLLYKAYGAVDYPNVNTSWDFFVPTQRSDGRPPLVLPGTQQVQVTFTWDSSKVLVKSFGLGYSTAASRAFHFLHPHASGETYKISIAPEEADNGHQYWTLWGFKLFTANSQASGAAFQPEVILGTVHVKVVIVKGNVVVDPPHEDFWQGNTSLLLRDYAAVLTYTTASGFYYHDDLFMYLESKRLVPPGTTRLHLKFSWASTDAPGTALDGDWGIRWKPANLQREATPTSAYKTAAPVSTTGTVKEYDVKVEPGETDAFYQKFSLWLFDAYNVRDASYQEGATDWHHSFRLQVTAYRDAGA